MASSRSVLEQGLTSPGVSRGLSKGLRSHLSQKGHQSTPWLQLAPRRIAHQRCSQHTRWANQCYKAFTTRPWDRNAGFSNQGPGSHFLGHHRMDVSQGKPGLPGQINASHANPGATGETHYSQEDQIALADDTTSPKVKGTKTGHVSLDQAVPLHLQKTDAGHVSTSSQSQEPCRGFHNRLRKKINRKAADILHTFRKDEKMEVEYATEEEELAALNEQRYKLASGLKRTLLKIGVCFIVLAVIKILNALREALLASPVDYFKLIGVLGSLDYWALAALVFDIRNTIMEIERNDGDGDPTVRVLEQENVAIGISFEKFFKRMFKVLSAIAFAQVLGALSMTGFQLAPTVDNGLKQLWSFVSPHL